MQFEQIIRDAAASADMSLSDVSLRLGHLRNYLNSYISKDRTPSIYNMARMLEPCGYDLVALPKGSAPPRALKVSPSAGD